MIPALPMGLAIPEGELRIPPALLAPAPTNIPARASKALYSRPS